MVGTLRASGQSGLGDQGSGYKHLSPPPRSYGITHGGLDISTPGERITCTCHMRYLLMSLFYPWGNWGAERIINSSKITSPVKGGSGKRTRFFFQPVTVEGGRQKQMENRPYTHKRNRNRRGEKKGKRTMLELMRMRASRGKETEVFNMRARPLIFWIWLLLLFPQLQFTSFTLPSSFPAVWHSSPFPQTSNDSFLSCPFTTILFSLGWMSCDLAAPQPSFSRYFFPTQLSEHGGRRVDCRLPGVLSHCGGSPSIL